MTSKQKLLDALTAHISLYHHHSQTQNLTLAPNPHTRPAVLRWFASLSPHQRRAHLTILDAKFISILLQMHHKLQSNGPGRFIVLPDLPQDDHNALPTLCYRKSEGLLRRSYENDVAQRAVRESIHLFSSREGEGGGSGESRCLGLDSMCVAEGLVEDVDSLLEVADRVSGGEFLREEGELGGEWVEMVWLKGRGYYGLEEFVVNRIEVALRLAWLGCGSGGGRKRGVRLKERLGAAGLAANLYWRKKGCVDWWEKLEVSVKRKVYCAYLGKAARSLIDDIVKGKHNGLDDEMWLCDDRGKQPVKCKSALLDRRERDIATSKDSRNRCNSKPVQDSRHASPLHCMFNSLCILQVISAMLSAAQLGGYDKEKLFFSSLDSVNSISDVVLRKLRELLMVVSLDCTKFELLGEGNMNSSTKKLNEHGASNRKKKGKNHKKKSNPIPRPCQADSKPIKPTMSDRDGTPCSSNQDIRQSNSTAQRKDITLGNLLSADTVEPVRGLNNGNLRSASRKSRKERKKLKGSCSYSAEAGSSKSRSIKLCSASFTSQDGPSVPDRAPGISAFENMPNNDVTEIDRPDVNPNCFSYIGTNSMGENAVKNYSVEPNHHLCLKHHKNMGMSDQNGAETTGSGMSICDSDIGSATIQPLNEDRNHKCTGDVGHGTYTDSNKNCTNIGFSEKQMQDGEPEGKPPPYQQQGNLGVLRFSTIGSPAYVSYEWPNVIPVHPSANTHIPATADRLHLDVGRSLQNHFHHSFVQPLQVRNSPLDNAYNGIISGPLPMSLDWPLAMHGVNRRLPAVTCNYDSEFIARRQLSLQQHITSQNLIYAAASSEDERTISSELMEFPDAVKVDEDEKHWMSEEELEAHAVNGIDYNQFFGGGVMYWNPSDHQGKSFSRPPSLCSDDSSWAWREADMTRAVDDMVAFSSSYSTNGLTSPSAASYCSPFDPLGPGSLGYVMPGSEIGGKVLHPASTMTDVGAEESVSGSMSNMSGDGDVKTVDSLPYPILRPIIIPSMSRERSRSDFKRSYDHKSPCVPPNRREHPRIKRPPSPVVLCVPRAPCPPPPSPVGNSRKQQGFPTVRSGSSSPRHWGVKGWLHDGVSFEEACIPIEGNEVVWPSWRNKGLSARQLTQPLAGTLLQDRLIAISQLARDQEHPDVTFPLQSPVSQNFSTYKASLVHDILHDEIDSFCKQVAAENLNRKPFINWAVKRVARSLQVLWPRSRTNVFGSNATGLSLPSSDVDLVVCLPPVRNLEPIKEAGILEGRNGIKETCLQHAARYLANQEWVKSDSLKIVENTAIPIIMLVVEVPHDLISSTMSYVQTPKEEAEQVASEEANPFQSDASSSESNASPKWDKITNFVNGGFNSVRLDISFKSPTHSGLQTTGLVKDLTERFPAVIPLVLVLKQFLADRSLDQSYSGGLSSYCLVLLVTRFLQHEHHQGRPINQNHGSLLMDFLYFFGNVFDPRQMRISVQGSGVYLNRERGCSIDPLCIDDPLFLTNNVGRNCFRIHQCIKAFADAYAMLENVVTHLTDNDDTDAKPTRKLLPKIIPSIGHLLGS